MLHARERSEIHNKILAGKLEGTTPLGRPGRRWEENITMDLINRDQWRAVMNNVMNLGVP